MMRGVKGAKAARYLPLAKAFITVYALNIQVRLWSPEEVLVLTGQQSNPVLVFWAKWLNSAAGLGAEALIVFACLALLYRRLKPLADRPLRRLSVVLGAVFALFTVFGASYAALDSWDFVFGGKYQLFVSFWMWLGHYFLYQSVLAALFARLQKGLAGASPLTGRWAWADRHFHLVAFGAIFLCWLPYWVVMFPGSLPGDGYVQLNMYNGYALWTADHPLTATLLMGWIFSLGRMISDNFGIALYVLPQMLLTAAVFARACAQVHRMNLSRRWAWGLVAFFGVVPLWASYAQAMIKDTLNLAFFLWFLLTYQQLLAGRACGLSAWMDLTFSGLLTVLTRNDRIYILLPCLLVLCAARVRQSGYWASAAAVVVAGNLAVAGLLMPAFGVLPGSTREMLSIPFQQTARYCIQYGGSVTEEERRVIDTVLDYDAIVRDYDPELSDYVKNHYKLAPGDTAALGPYFRVWFQQLCKHPDAYIQATLNNTFGYFYPFYDYNGRTYYQLYIDGPPVATGDLDVHYVMPQGLRSALKAYAEAWRTLPVLAQVMNPATYVWVFLALCGVYLAKRRWRQLAPAVPGVLIILMCMASPVNGYTRYLLPLMAYLPVLAAGLLEHFAARSQAGAPAEQ